MDKVEVDILLYMEVLMLRREEGFPPTIFSCLAILTQFGSLIEIEIETTSPTSILSC